MSKNTEVEIRFLEINVPALLERLHEVGAKDLGEDFLREIIFYDKDMTFRKERKVVRLRKTKSKILLTYKKHSLTSSTATEIELEVNDEDKTVDFLESLGLVAFRKQEKKRHTFTLDGIIIDIDTWPSIPTYVELEGSSEKALKAMAKKLELKGEMHLEPAGVIIEKYYHIPIHDLRFFTFDKIA